MEKPYKYLKINKSMSILENIIADKKIEVQQNKSLYPVALLDKTEAFTSPIVSLKKYLQKKIRTA